MRKKISVFAQSEMLQRTKQRQIHLFLCHSFYYLSPEIRILGLASLLKKIKKVKIYKKAFKN